MSERDKIIPCKKIRCPKCGKAPRNLLEIWRYHCIQFGYVGNGRSAEGWMSEGNPYKVEAQCACGHAWNLRGVVQITDLDHD